MIAGDTIDRVTRFHGGDLPVVSVYLGLDADRRDLRSLATRVSSLLHEIRPMAKDSDLGREARLSVRGDVERIEAEMAEDRPNPGAIAIFSCSGRQFYEEVQLPRRVRDRIAVDATPWVRPLLAVLDEFHRACVLVLDSQTAHLWELYQGEITERGEIHQTQQLVDEPPLRKPDYGGWGGLEERGVHNRTGELAKKHFRRVAAALDDLHRRGRFDLLAIGGHDHELPVFQDFLPHSVRGSVVGTFSIDSNTATVADIRTSAQVIVDRHERAEEQRWVAELLAKEASGGNAAVGLERCLWAGTVAAVQRLLVHDEATAPGVVCDESGWLGEDGDTCPLCQGPTRATDDVIDELAQAVIDTGGSVEHVLAETPLQEPLVAADLRFALPPRPGADA
jgi:hypothetical protein